MKLKFSNLLFFSLAAISLFGQNVNVEVLVESEFGSFIWWGNAGKPALVFTSDGNPTKYVYLTKESFEKNQFVKVENFTIKPDTYNVRYASKDMWGEQQPYWQGQLTIPNRDSQIKIKLWEEKAFIGKKTKVKIHVE